MLLLGFLCCALSSCSRNCVCSNKNTHTTVDRGAMSKNDCAAQSAYLQTVSNEPGWICTLD